MFSSTGDILKVDTPKIAVPISFIKDANAKLIERLYLIKVNAEKDSINNLNKLYILQQKNIIVDFQNRVVDLNNKNIKYQSIIDNKTKVNNILKGTTGILIVVVGFFIFK